jgi:hypothetical protein
VPSGRSSRKKKSPTEETAKSDVAPVSSASSTPISTDKPSKIEKLSRQKKPKTSVQIVTKPVKSKASRKKLDALKKSRATDTESTEEEGFSSDAPTREVASDGRAGLVASAPLYTDDSDAEVGSSEQSRGSGYADSESAGTSSQLKPVSEDDGSTSEEDEKADSGSGELAIPAEPVHHSQVSASASISPRLSNRPHPVLRSASDPDVLPHPTLHMSDDDDSDDSESGSSSSSED